MAGLRTIEEYVYGPGGDRKQGLVSAIPEILELAKRQNITTIEIEIRKEAPGAPSTQEGTERLRADSDPDTVCQAIMKRLQEAPGDDFKGKLRLNFRESGRTANLLRSYERTMQGSGGAVDAAASGATVPIEHYRAANEETRRAMDSAIRSLNATAFILEKVGTVLVNLINPQQPQAAGASRTTDLLAKTLGVFAAGTQDPAKGAAAAAQVLADLESKPIPASSATSSATSSASSPSSASNQPADISAEQAEAWARRNPDAARQMAMKLMQEGAA